jgi:hypothetical protein
MELNVRGSHALLPLVALWKRRPIRYREMLFKLLNLGLSKVELVGTPVLQVKGHSVIQGDGILELLVLGISILLQFENLLLIEAGAEPLNHQVEEPEWLVFLHKVIGCLHIVVKVSHAIVDLLQHVSKAILFFRVNAFVQFVQAEPPLLIL